MRIENKLCGFFGARYSQMHKLSLTETLSAPNKLKWFKKYSWFLRQHLYHAIGMPTLEINNSSIKMPFRTCLILDLSTTLCRLTTVPCDEHNYHFFRR